MYPISCVGEKNVPGENEVWTELRKAVLSIIDKLKSKHYECVIIAEAKPEV